MGKLYSATTAVFMAVLLAGCISQTVPNPGSPVPPPVTDVGKAVSKAQDYIDRACGFIVSYDSLFALAERFVLRSDGDIRAAANEVCAALTRKSMTRSAGLPTVRGVPIRAMRSNRPLAARG
jgi:hypothetical protein